ncbi:MAG: PAS domain S-box protein [Deltaproteobacteria bacterium]|nr:PAS domain S-box protein [Deltaproteobacteria bacterium]
MQDPDSAAKPLAHREASVSGALSESERRYQTLFSNNVAGIFYQRADGRLIDVNERALELFGLTRDQFLGQTSMHPEWRVLDDDGLELNWQKHPSILAMRTGREVRNARLAVYNPIRRHFVWLKVDAVPEFRDGENQPHQAFVTVTDVTEQREAEIALKASEARYRSLFQNMINGFALHQIVVDNDGAPVDYVFLEANEAFETITGLKSDAIIGRKVTEVLPGIEKDPADWIGRYGRVALGGGEIRFDQESASLKQWFSVSAYSPQKGQFATIFEDITERKQTELALKQSEDKFHTLFRTSPFGLTLSTIDEGRFVEANDAFCHMLKYSKSDLVGRSSLDLDLWENLADRNEMVSRLQHQTDGKPAKGEYRLVCKTGKCVDVIYEAQIIRLGQDAYIFSCFNDITETRKLEEQLRQSQKLESVGRLAGGVAHDFNNMLGIIIGHSEMILDTLEPADEIYDSLMEIQDAADRSARLTRQLLAFARKQAITPKNIDLNEEISATMGMLTRLIGETIVLEWAPADTPCIIKMDPTQIVQILTNLTINARDAIDNSGTIKLRTERISIDNTSVADHEGCATGNYILLTATDDGCGMDSDTLEQIFEPFFTTKDVGEGTGLGLSTIYGIVKQNNGVINVHSSPGAGSTFYIYFPETRIQATETDPGHSQRNNTSGRHTILLVEDDKAVLHMTRLILEKNGYQIISTHEPEKALQLASDFNGEIDLVITDVIMPELNGKELVEQLKPICPGAIHLFASGYTADVLSPKGIVAEDVHFIQKPYTKRTLLKKIQALLSKSKPDSN